MKNLFNPDSFIAQLLSRLADLVVANILFLLCSLPVVTIGASAAALSKVTQDMAMNAEGKTARTFFEAFKANFKQATLAWLVMLAVIVGLVLDFMLIDGHYTGVMQLVMLVAWVAVAVLLVCVSSYLFPLMVRYQNGLKQHLNNALLLAVGKLPRTLCMLVLHSVGPVLLIAALDIFVQTLIVWIVIGFAGISYLDHLMLLSVFRELEQPRKTEV